jgi:integration host factor subunit alpha
MSPRALSLASKHIETNESAYSPEAEDASTRGALTRVHLAEAVHRTVGVSRVEAARYVEAVLDEIFNTLTAREDVKLASFGTFSVRAKRARDGRNPKTGVGAKISARLVVVFKASTLLRSRINGEADPEE